MRAIDRRIDVRSGNIELSLGSPRQTIAFMLIPLLKKKLIQRSPTKAHVTHKNMESNILKYVEKSPKLSDYDGKGDPDEHVQLVNDQLSYFSIDDASKCKLFMLTQVDLTLLWFNVLPDGSIESWAEFRERFYAYFIARKQGSIIKTALRWIIQGRKEILWPYIDRFKQVSVEVKGTQEGI